MMDEWEDLIAASASADDDPYVRFDEFQDVAASLRLLIEACRFAEDEPPFWKWIVLSAHSALQGACVCYLTQTDGSGALTEKSERDLRLYHDLSTQRAIVEAHGGEWILEEPRCPDERVASMPDLLRRLPEDLRVDIPKNGSMPDNQPDQDISRLHDLRNRFTHFPSLHWSIETIGLPRISRTAVDLVRTIMQRNDFPRHNRFQDMDMDSLFTEAAEAISRLDLGMQRS